MVMLLVYDHQKTAETIKQFKKEIYNSLQYFLALSYGLFWDFCKIVRYFNIKSNELTQGLDCNELADVNCR